MFKIGDKVKYKVDWNGYNKNLEGLVTQVHGDGTFIVLWDDNFEAKYYPDVTILELAKSDVTPTKGLRYNENKLRWRNFPMFLLEPVIEVGAKAEKHDGNPDGKYPTFNFLAGMEMNDSLDSLKRHLMKFESPYHSDDDEESKCSHLAHIAWNALVALHNLRTRPDLDDRWKGENV